MSTSKILKIIQTQNPKAELVNRYQDGMSWVEIVVPYGFLMSRKLAKKYGRTWVVMDSDIKKILKENNINCILEDRTV